MYTFLKGLTKKIHVTGNFRGSVSEAITQSIQLAKQLEVVIVLHFNDKEIVITKDTQKECAEQDYFNE